MSKVWFITGAGSGIGAETAKTALKAGDRVVATGRNLEKVRNALRNVASEKLANGRATAATRPAPSIRRSIRSAQTISTA